MKHQRAVAPGEGPATGLPAMAITIWGARGSVPAPGPGQAIFGGNTPCVELAAGDEVIVIDAGTGIVPLGQALIDRRVKRIHLLLSHLHHDHTAGLPFFAPLFDLSVEIIVYCGMLEGTSARDALDEVFRPPYFPLRFSAMAPQVRHVGFTSGESLRIGDLGIATTPLNHPGGATAFRFERAGRSFVYATDVENLSATPDPAMVDFVRGADLLIYDTMLDAAAAAACEGWGHSTWEGGVTLADAAGVKVLAGFHHHPLFDDARLTALEKAMQQRRPESYLCREGQVIAV
jgi:phosphoribosyl 1,2-cyclic phosphodiesterase